MRKMPKAKQRRLLKQADKVAVRARIATKRTCGDCTACCTRLRIEALHKPQCRACPHLADAGGCGIYERRPNECRTFICGWLLGWGTEDDRPDKSGVIVTVPGRTRESRFFRLLSTTAEPLADSEAVRALQKSIRDKMERRSPDYPVGFMIDTGGGSARFEMPQGTAAFFAAEIAAAGGETGAP